MIYNMDNLPVGVIRKMHEYDSTYKIRFDKVLKQLSAHRFIYRCRICFNEWGKCFCYCPTCRTYFRFCQQIYYSNGSVYEEELNEIKPLGFLIKAICLTNNIYCNI